MYHIKFISVLKRCKSKWMEILYAIIYVNLSSHPNCWAW